MLFKSELRILLLNSGDPQSSPAHFLNSDLQRSPKFTRARLLFKSDLYGSSPNPAKQTVQKWACPQDTTIQNCRSLTKSHPISAHQITVFKQSRTTPPAHTDQSHAGGRKSPFKIPSVIVSAYVVTAASAKTRFRMLGVRQKLRVHMR